jgi:flagellar hook protein FlgE
MLRSLFTGVSGLRAHQQMLDVTSNNIANVNTTGYKANETTFEDTLSQTLNPPTASVTTANGSEGGQNPNQIGLGVKLAGTQSNFSQGQTQSTGRNEDVMINGDGFFVTVRDGLQAYTRAGSLHVSPASNAAATSAAAPTGYTYSAGTTQIDTTNLVEPDGSILQGYSYSVNPGDPTTAPPTMPSVTGSASALGNLTLQHLTDGTFQSWSIQPNGNINAVDKAGNTLTIGTIATATFANPAGLTRIGDTSYTETTASGQPQIGAPTTGSRGSLSADSLEMSNVDLATEFTNLIISERGFQANSRVITTSDEVLQALVQLKS